MDTYGATAAGLAKLQKLSQEDMRRLVLDKRKGISLSSPDRDHAEGPPWPAGAPEPRGGVGSDSIALAWRSPPGDSQASVPASQEAGGTLDLARAALRDGHGDPDEDEDKDL